jgi:BolA family transcriptional regulator, general stress-responsive regulator
MTRQQRMTEILTREFTPHFLEVVDESHHHAGHSGARPGGETHYHVTIKATCFLGQTRVKMHRAVNTAMQKEFDSGLHALGVTAST